MKTYYLKDKTRGYIMEEINNAIRDFIKDKDKNDYKYYVDSEKEYYIQENLVKIIRDNLEEYFKGRLYL